MYALLALLSFCFLAFSVTFKKLSYTTPTTFFVIAYGLHTLPGAIFLSSLSVIDVSVEAKVLAVIWISITYIVFAIPFFVFNNVQLKVKNELMITVNYKLLSMLSLFMILGTISYIYSTGAFQALKYALSGDMVNAYFLRTNITSNYGFWLPFLFVSWGH